MRILLDELIPKKFLPYVSDLGASRVDIEGWRGLKNGRLLDAAEEAGFGVLLTCDKQLRYQQNFAGRRIAVLVVDVHPTSLEVLIFCLEEIKAAILALEPGEVRVLEGPHPKRNK